MTVKELIEKNIFTLKNSGDDLERKIEDVYCCDLLSIAMGRAPQGCAWVTVMGNINTLAVASLTDVSVVIIAEGAALDDTFMNKAIEQEITILFTEEPVFKAAYKVWEMINV